MTFYTKCPDCGNAMEIQRLNNGVAMVWHGIHCGWGQAYMADEDVYFDQALTQPLVQGAANKPAITWFLVAEVHADRTFIVLRLDRTTLPKATVVSGPHITQAEAEQIAAEMREFGTA